MAGQQVCRMHGGAAPQARAAAEQRVAQAQAERVLLSIWNPSAEPVTDSVGEMQKLAGSLRQAVDVLGGQLDLGEACEACGRGSLDLGSVEAVAWVRVLRELRTLLADMERLGIANRVVELAQGQAEIVVLAFRAALEAAGASLLPADRAVMVETFLDRLGRGDNVVAGELVGGGATS